MNIERRLGDIARAGEALRLGQPHQAVTTVAPVLEGVLRELVLKAMETPRFASSARRSIEVQARRFSKQGRTLNATIKLATLGQLSALFTKDFYRALEDVTARSTLALETFNISTLASIRSGPAHETRDVTDTEGRLIVYAAEVFLDYLFPLPEGDAPLRFSSRDECLKILLRRLWLFPHSGSRTSWAVKESRVLKGELDVAIARPGLGIALFTTELASRVFGNRADEKIRACVQWGFGRTSPTPPYLILEPEVTFIDDATTIESDFRHTIALAILMARSGMHRTHQAYYLELLLENPCKDGGWPKVIGRQVSDLPATAYVVEYLATWSKHSPPSLLPRIGEAIRGGQDWLILAARSDGGWSTGIFSTPWDGLWSTAYILPRLLASALPAFPEWSQALLEATIAVLRDACEMEYKNDREEFRIEARVAAALAAALRTLGLDDLFRGRVENWLERWESRFLETLTHLSAKECDLATSTFAAAALLRNRNPADVGKQSLSEL